MSSCNLFMLRRQQLSVTAAKQQLLLAAAGREQMLLAAATPARRRKARITLIVIVRTEKGPCINNIMTIYFILGQSVDCILLECNYFIPLSCL
jgi:hypothetical protein